MNFCFVDDVRSLHCFNVKAQEQETASTRRMAARKGKNQGTSFLSYRNNQDKIESATAEAMFIQFFREMQELLFCDAIVL